MKGSPMKSKTILSVVAMIVVTCLVGCQRSSTSTSKSQREKDNEQFADIERIDGRVNKLGDKVKDLNRRFQSPRFDRSSTIGIRVGNQVFRAGSEDEGEIIDPAELAESLGGTVRRMEEALQSQRPPVPQPPVVDKAAEEKKLEDLLTKLVEKIESGQKKEGDAFRKLLSDLEKERNKAHRDGQKEVADKLQLILDKLCPPDASK